MSIEEAERIVGKDENDIPDIYYYPKRSQFWVCNGRGKFAPHGVGHIHQHLQRRRLSKEEIAEEVFRIRHECDVDAVAVIAGARQGIKVELEKTILVPEEPPRIVPKRGEWPILKEIILNMLGKEQQEWLYGWLKQWVGAFHAYNWQPGQMLVLIGPVAAGKSLLQDIFNQIFGTRPADPLQWMMGGTFNLDLLASTHLCIEDKFAGSEKAVKDALRENCKSLAVNPWQKIEGKHQDAVYLRPLWRVTISCNPDVPESMYVIPPLDESTYNKLSLLWCEVAEMPMPTATGEEKVVFMDALKGELPAFVHYLLHEHEVSAEMACPEKRMGVRAYHHPEALNASESKPHEARKMEKIHEALNGDGREGWEGTSTELLEILRCKGQRSLFRTAESLGRFLKQATKSVGHRRYRIEMTSG